MGNSTRKVPSGGAANSKTEQEPTSEVTPQKPAPRAPSLAVNFIFSGLIVSAIIVLGLCILLAQSHSILSVQASVLIGLALAIMISVLAYLLFAYAVSARGLMGQLNHILTTNKNLREEVLTLQTRQRDIQRAYREEKIRAQEANRSKAAFLAHLSHDIRTPLNHIIGFADLIGHQTFGPLGDTRYLTYIKDIKQSGEGLLLSIAGVLELAELESGQRILSTEAIIIDDFLDALKSRFSARALRCGITLEIKNNCGVELMGDAMGLVRIMENLLDNAMRFTLAGGRIQLTSWVADDGVILEVTDTGIGISPERQTQIFSPFSLEDAARSKEHGSMGMGLAIARALTELSGGEIAIESTPAIGTTVAVSLPFNATKKTQNTIAA